MLLPSSLPELFLILSPCVTVALQCWKAPKQPRVWVCFEKWKGSSRTGFRTALRLQSGFSTADAATAEAYQALVYGKSEVWVRDAKLEQKIPFSSFYASAFHVEIKSHNQSVDQGAGEGRCSGCWRWQLRAGGKPLLLQPPVEVAEDQLNIKKQNQKPVLQMESSFCNNHQ